MAKLYFLLDGHSLGEFALDKERLTIGRRPSNHIHIDNLAVSGEHAAIVTIGKDSFLEDLNSTNGTVVNGKTIKKHVLQHDDVITFGKYQLRYVNENQANSASQHGFEKTMLLAPQRAPKPIVAQTDEAQPAIAEKAQPADTMPHAHDKKPILNDASNVTASNVNIARLQVLSGTSAGRELILNKTMTTLGKPGSQVAVINRRPNGYFITHVEGNSLPTVNEQTIGVQAYALNHGDIVALAGTKLAFFLD